MSHVRYIASDQSTTYEQAMADSEQEMAMLMEIDFDAKNISEIFQIDLTPMLDSESNEKLYIKFFREDKLMFNDMTVRVGNGERDVEFRVDREALEQTIRFMESIPFS